MGETSQLAGFLAAASFDRLPREVVAQVKTLLLDHVGVALAGSLSAESRMVSGLVRELGGSAGCTVVGSAFLTSAPQAAFANAVAAHVLDLDDTHLASVTHPGAPVIPAALALAEQQGASGATAIAAIALGYEACLRIAAAVQPSHARRGFLSMGTCGTFGAAAAAGHCLELDKTALAHALGLAGTQSAGLNVSSFGQGDMGRRLIPGHASAAGVLAALLAQRGFTGSATVLEGRNGFCTAFADDVHLGRMTEGLGETYEALRTGLKPYACNRQSHAAIDAMLQIRRECAFDPARVRRVQVRTFDAAVAGRPHRAAPVSLIDATSSIPFILAIAACRGSAGHEDFDVAALEDATLKSFASKVIVEADAELSAMHPRHWPARVSVEFDDGHQMEREVVHPKGEPECPLSGEEVRGKFMALATTVLNADAATELAQEIDELDRRAGVARLMGLLRSPWVTE